MRGQHSLYFGDGARAAFVQTFMLTLTSDAIILNNNVLNVVFETLFR